MKALVLLLVVVGGFFAYPLLSEDSSSECDALERAAVRAATGPGGAQAKTPESLVGQFILGFSKGRFASEVVKNKYPEMPASAACAMLYWKAALDPESLRQVVTNRQFR
jgi:hypothetical protein